MFLHSEEKDAFLQRLANTPRCDLDALSTRRVVDRITTGLMRGSPAFLDALKTSLTSDRWVTMLKTESKTY